MTSESSRHSETAFSVDLSTRQAILLPDTSMAEVGILERQDLQRWIEKHPEIVGPDLLVVSSEFDQWQIRDHRVLDRLDLLFLDSRGSLVVAELKRDAAPDATELQALKYAAYCSQLTVSDVVEQYGRHHQVDVESARTAILDHAPALADRELGPIRVRLVATSFGPSVTHVVLFLIDLGLDIGCIELRARRHGESHAILTARQLIPPPVADDYLVKRRRKEQEEESRESKTRRRNSVVVINEAGTIKPEEIVTLNLAAFTAEQRGLVEALLAKEPDAGEAAWTGEGSRSALRWRRNGDIHSCSSVIVSLLRELGFDPGSIPGPDYWIVPATGKTLYQTSCAIEDAAAA
jgi:RecB family endonuclease NucS